MNGDERMVARLLQAHLMGDKEEAEKQDCRIMVKTAVMTRMFCECGAILDQKTASLLEVVVSRKEEDGPEQTKYLGVLCPDCRAKYVQKHLENPLGIPVFTKVKPRWVTWLGYQDFSQLHMKPVKPVKPVKDKRWLVSSFDIAVPGPLINETHMSSVMGWVCKGLGVHDRSNNMKGIIKDKWTLTHLASGYGLCSFTSKANAMKQGKYIADHVDCTLPKRLFMDAMLLPPNCESFLRVTAAARAASRIVNQPKNRG